MIITKNIGFYILFAQIYSKRFHQELGRQIRYKTQFDNVEGYAMGIALIRMGVLLRFLLIFRWSVMNKTTLS